MTWRKHRICFLAVPKTNPCQTTIGLTDTSHHHMTADPEMITWHESTGMVIFAPRWVL